MNHCQQAFVAGVVGVQLLLTGCSGTSQDDMRSHAIRRTSDDEDSAAEVSGTNDVASSGSQANVTAPPATAPAGDAVASRPSSPQLTSTDETASHADAGATHLEAIPSATTPAEPLSPAERRKRTASNLQQIGDAWRAYVNDKRYFPGPITNPTKQPLLSWRVELLPYLGLQALYDAFHLDEAWDSPHNIKLLDKIPDVFQSPERFDTKTNYLALSLGGTTVYQERRTVLESNVEDGKENTLALVEVDDERAVPWTQPTEFPLVMATPLKSLGKLRENGLFVVWSDGKNAWIDGAVDANLFAKACTIDSGDGFRGSQIAGDLATGIAPPAEPSDEVAKSESIGAVAEVKPIDAAPTTGMAQRPSLSDAQASLLAARDVKTTPSYRKQPIPSAPDLKIARDLLRDLYQDEYVAAKTGAQRLQLVRDMLKRLSDLGGDLAGQHALLEIVKQVSIQAGSVEVALEATDQMNARFELDGDVLLDTLEKLTRTATDRREQDRLLEEVDDVFNDLVVAEQYEAAERLSQLAASVASKAKADENVDKFSMRRNWASAAKELHKAAATGLATLEDNPEDPRANADVGKFLCLIKGDWQNGLVILANGNDRSLKRLAQLEIGDVSESTQKLELAELWWREAASSAPALQATLQTRAKHWYQQALPGLPAGLVRIRVERRIEEIGGDRPKS